MSDFDFEIGQLVVCIEDTFKAPAPGQRTRERDPVCGMIYTVRDIGEWADGTTALYLEEIQHGEREGEPAYPAPCFRKAKATNIAPFNDLLEPIARMPRTVASVVDTALAMLDETAAASLGLADEWGREGREPRWMRRRRA